MTSVNSFVGLIWKLDGPTLSQKYIPGQGDILTKGCKSGRDITSRTYTSGQPVISGSLAGVLSASYLLVTLTS